jgi:hypothetical protein
MSKSSASVGEGVSLSGAPITVDEDEDGRIEVKHARVSSVWSHFGPKYLTSIEIEIEIVYNNTSKNRLLSLGPPFCYAIQDLKA